MSDTLTLGGKTIRLVPPPSYAAVNDVLIADDKNPQRAVCAALGMCARGPGRPPLRFDAHDYDALKYGGAVLDWCVAQGIPTEEVFALGVQARRLMLESIVTKEDLDAAGNGSGAEEAPQPA